jgi:phospholipid/cholesterol/gamma-HCH transport system substrate-binding protein
MTDSTTITTAEGAAEAAARRRKQQRQRFTVYGLLLVAGILLVVTLIIRAFTAGGTYISMSALVSRAGDALQDGDEVRFRDIIVGKLVGTGELRGDQTLLHLNVEPAEAAQIPGDVTARPVPTTLFGSQFVELVEPSGGGHGQLRGGVTIPADTSPGTTALQTALAEVDSLLAAIHPAQLDVALTNLATALSGQGEKLGSLVDNLDAYVRQLTPLTPEIQDDITKLAGFVDELGSNAPALLETISNLTTTAQTLTSHQDQLRGLLSGGITLSDDVNAFLTANGDRIVTVVTDLQPVLGAVDQNTRGLTDGVLNLGALARNWTTFLGGHSAHLNLLLKNIDIGATVTASLGGPTGRPAADRAFAALLNPAPYTADSCPRYPGANGPNCSSGARPAVTRSTANGGSVGPVGSPDEQHAVQVSIAQLLGVPPETVPPVITDLLAGPMLRGTTVVRLSHPTNSAPDHREFAGAPR